MAKKKLTKQAARITEVAKRVALRMQKGEAKKIDLTTWNFDDEGASLIDTIAAKIATEALQIAFENDEGRYLHADLSRRTVGTIEVYLGLCASDDDYMQFTFPLRELVDFELGMYETNRGEYVLEPKDIKLLVAWRDELVACAGLIDAALAENEKAPPN